MQSAEDYSAQTTLHAHRQTINGCRSGDHDLDSGAILLEEAHGVLSTINTLLAEQKESVVPDKLLYAALRGAETLLAMGLRDVMVGHSALLSEVSRH